MNRQAARLLEHHFDTAFAAPDGIKKLRELILSLAMQGRLVQQDPQEQSASELLKEIEAEKKRLVKAGKIKDKTGSREGAKMRRKIKAEEMPYALPQGWEWVRIRNICHDWGQKTPDSRFTYIDVGSIDNKAGVIGQEVQVLEAHEAPSRARKLVQKGTVIYSTVRPYLLNIAIIEGEFEHEPIASTAFAILHPFFGISNRFIYSYLRSPVFIKYVEGTMKGIAYPAINDGDFFQGIFPLPPLPEQRRIVAKIDQLMARCDELEKLRAEREQKRLTVHTAALNRLLMATKGDDFSSAWCFISQHFGKLYSVKENVAELRKGILQLAVMGRLVPQDPQDQPASELLQEIEAEKKRLVKEGKIKAPKPLPEITPEEVPYELPKGWEWVRLESFMPEYQNGISKRGASIGIETIVVRLADIIRNEISLINTRRIRLTEQEQSKYLLHPGDILITRVNGSVDLVGSIIRVRARDSTLAYCDHFIRVRLHPNTVDVDYLHAISKGALIRRQIEGKFITTAGQKTVNQTHISTLIFPLPPLAEQHRIVVKIDQLMVHCDELEKQIETATGKQAALLNAVMAQV
jgi:type I restriction enzyme S subunit